MGQYILAGNPPIPVTLRQSTRARRISLRVSGLDGRVTLTVPYGVAEREAIGFAKEKEAWLRAQLDRGGDMQWVGFGADIPIEGKQHQIVAGSGRRVVIAEGTVSVPGNADRISVRLAAHLRAMARDRLAEASDHYAQRLGKSYSRLSLRDTRSRWGSCSAAGVLMYSWRLIMAPPDVLRYVAAHEVSHLAHMDHSRAFWSTVERLYGSYEQQRAWLRTNGATLHRVRFDD